MRMLKNEDKGEGQLFKWRGGEREVIPTPPY